MINQMEQPNVATVHLTPEMQECLDNCTRCHQVCLETLNYCLKLGGRYTDSVHLRLLMDCAEMCQTSANFMLRASDLHNKVCGVCAVICLNCATDCERFTVSGEGSGAAMSKHSGKAEVSEANVDEQMKLCAQTCRECARTCQQMADMPMNA